MVDPTRTTTLLLEGRLNATNATVWSQFDRRYRPVLLGFARRLELDDADAADIAQEVMSEFIEGFRAGTIDVRHGGYQELLRSMAGERIARLQRERAERRDGRRGSALVHLRDEARLTRVWDSELRRVMLRKAMVQLRQSTRTSEVTINAFELLVVRQMSPTAVAAQLDMTVADVYAAKSRVARRLRQILDALEAAYLEP